MSDFESASQKPILTKSVPYEGIPTFLRSEYTRDLKGVDLAVYGVPFDLSTFNRSGARFGPRSIRELSCYLSLLGTCWPHKYRIDHQFKLIDYGDIGFFPGQIDNMLQNLESAIKELCSHDVLTLGLGGDHLVAYPAIKALAQQHGPLSLIHFDAHTDTVQMPHLTHGSMFYYAAKEGLIDPENSIQIGIRTSVPETPKLHVITANQCFEMGTQQVVDKIRNIVGTRKCYISLDVDGMDPAFTPGTGTPMPGGLTSAMQREILWGLVGLNMIGGDVVEVSPPYDVAQTTALVGATVAIDLLYILGNTKLRKG
ncbi:agmatinase [Legionella bononiensis]|uniref:Agmatinase n=1 Tax=Legionella bononiensis TaxID=2793102 RepID=A0ABS1W829_9GAMM|nr:agmatinase [Legionella bononiensis]MBL7479968.1 agmatinase [Legionella bononiensis]MBL7525518.1 agmatinase [Legionella bononiensis]MBL7561701.1 agmatinase [Legionella bononiensis]